jgi:hypothetical protein
MNPHLVACPSAPVPSVTNPPPLLERLRLAACAPGDSQPGNKRDATIFQPLCNTSVCCFRGRPRGCGGVSKIDASPLFLEASSLCSSLHATLAPWPF